MASSVSSMDTLGKGMIHVLGKMVQEFIHTTQNGAQFKTHELFISGILHLIFSDHGWPWVTETAKSETVEKGELLCMGWGLGAVLG